MNLFRSEEHLQRWPLVFQSVGDYVMPVSDWAEVFSVSMFRRRLEPDYLARSKAYLQDYHDALRSKGKPVPSPDRVLLTVMFTDIVDSTGQAARIGDDTWAELLRSHDEMTRHQITHFDGTEIKKTGDGSLSSFAGPTRAIRCAAAIRRGAAELGLVVRIGIHSGECEILGDDIGGIGVHIAARVAATSGPSEILVTETVVDATTGSAIEYVERGAHELKGVPGTWRLHAAMV